MLVDNQYHHRTGVSDYVFCGILQHKYCAFFDIITSYVIGAYECGRHVRVSRGEKKWKI